MKHSILESMLSNKKDIKIIGLPDDLIESVEIGDDTYAVMIKVNGRDGKIIQSLMPDDPNYVAFLCIYNRKEFDEEARRRAVHGAEKPKLKKIIMVGGYAHPGLTNMKVRSTSWQEAFVDERVVHPVLGTCLVGRFVTGAAAIGVHFPIKMCRVANDKERAELCARTYENTFGAPSFSLHPEQFAGSLDEI